MHTSCVAATSLQLVEVENRRRPKRELIHSESIQNIFSSYEKRLTAFLYFAPNLTANFELHFPFKVSQTAKTTPEGELTEYNRIHSALAEKY